MFAYDFSYKFFSYRCCLLIRYWDGTLLNFVRLSWKVSKYLFPDVVTLRRPTMSNAHFSNGLLDVSVIINGILVFLLNLFFWQSSHFAIYSSTSFVIPVQLCIRMRFNVRVTPWCPPRGVS